MKCEEPITRWLKSGGGVDGGGGDRESCRASKALAGVTAFSVKNCLQESFSQLTDTIQSHHKELD